MRNAGGSNGTKVVRAVRDWVSSALKSAGLPDRLEVGGEKKGGVGNDTTGPGPQVGTAARLGPHDKGIREYPPIVIHTNTVTPATVCQFLLF